MASNTKRVKIYGITQGRCYYCGCELNLEDYHIDHVMPKAKGGKTENNLAPACQDCNLYKGDLSVEEFREKIQGLISDRSIGRLISKYYAIEKKDITFYFEQLESEKQNE